MHINNCKCGAPAVLRKSGVVHKILCTKCFCRAVGQSQEKIIDLWNNGISRDEQHAKISVDNDFISTEIITNGKTTGFSMDRIAEYLKQ